MMLRRLDSILLIVLHLAVGQAAWAGVPAAQASPLLFVRIAGPAGMTAGLFADGSLRRFPAPVVVGLRPGYVYTVEIGRLSDQRGSAGKSITLYPTIEVRGTLAAPAGVNPMQYPVPVNFSESEVTAARSGALLTKVLFVENPDRALPEATRPDEPVVFDVRPGGDPVAEARERGRLLAIVRLGEKEPAAEELKVVTGTVWLPGQHGLAQPTRPPDLPAVRWPTFDPHWGPPATGECLRDGGDAGPRAGYGPDGRLYGVDPADTVAEYTDSRGARHVTPSNPVCLFAPRFAATRGELVPAGYSATFGLAGTESTSGGVALVHRVPPLLTTQSEQPVAMAGRRRASGTQASTGLIALDQFLGPAEIGGRIKGVAVSASCLKKPAAAPPGPLVLRKSADRTAARSGDVVTFTLRYFNTGGQPITDVVVSDSLTGRLEFVPDSSRTDREAVFTTRENEAESALLRWKIGGVLPPGQSGTITFQARVR